MAVSLGESVANGQIGRTVGGHSSFAKDVELRLVAVVSDPRHLQVLHIEGVRLRAEQVRLLEVADGASRS